MSRRSGFVFVLAVMLFSCVAVVSTGEAQTALSQHSYRIWYVTDVKQIDYVVDQFRGEIRRSGSNANVVECNNVAKLTEEGIKDFSFGAVCTVQNGNNRSTVLMCDDSLAGKFTWAESGSLTRDDVVHFIKKNCLPGK
jgi:predicted transcriptional regulator